MECEIGGCNKKAVVECGIDKIKVCQEHFDMLPEWDKENVEHHIISP